MIQCQWCQAQNQPGTTSCQTCGAPLDERNKVSDSGWREAPRLRDMTEFRFSGSTCQVEGELVPVAEINLHPQDALYFEHHVLLWKDETVPLSSMNTGGGLKRSIGGMPHIVTVANGPGRIAFSRNAPGEKILVEPGGFLYKDSTVQMQAMQMPLKTGLLRHGMYLAEMTGPGRVGIQSMYVHHHAD